MALSCQSLILKPIKREMKEDRLLLVKNKNDTLPDSFRRKERNYADIPPDKMRVQNLEVGQSHDGSSH